MKKCAAPVILTINSYKFPALCCGEKDALAWAMLVPSRLKLLELQFSALAESVFGDPMVSLQNLMSPPVHYSANTLEEIHTLCHPLLFAVLENFGASAA